MFEIAAGKANKNPSFAIHADLGNINFHRQPLQDSRRDDTRGVNVRKGDVDCRIEKNLGPGSSPGVTVFGWAVLLPTVIPAFAGTTAVASPAATR